MTDAAKPEPGWYIITAPDGEMSCQRFGVRPYDYKFGLDLPPGCTLGPRIEDLLRDAARYREALSALAISCALNLNKEQVSTLIEFLTEKRGLM